MTKPVIAIIILMIAAGCKVGPNYSAPNPSVPGKFSEATTRPSTQPVAPLARWWQAFNDPMLDSLIEQSVHSNLDLRLATLRVREARAQRGIVAADLYPNVDVNGTYTHRRGTANPVGGKRDIDLYEVGFDASWEIDVFGGVQRSVEAADADIQAAAEARNDTLVTLLAEVARAYIDLRGAQHDLTITQNNLRSQQETLNLTQERFRAGISSDLDVARAEAQVATTSSQVPSLETQIRQAIHQLGVLIGREPNALADELTPTKTLEVLLPSVPPGLPSELLRRRPDIRLAERQLSAATARVGVATADLFPRFSLTGSYAWDANRPKNLFSDASNIWSIGPSVSWPIFDAGRIRANIRVQDTRQEEALTVYEKTVLSALQEVEDSLVSYDREQARRVALARSVSSNRRAVDLATQLYSRGLVDFLSVLDAQRALFIAEDLLVRSDTSLSEDLIALYKALGGGWNWDEQTPTTQPTE